MVLDIPCDTHLAHTVVEYPPNAVHRIYQVLSTKPHHLTSLSLQVEYAQLWKVTSLLQGLSRPATLLKDLSIFVHYPSNQPVDHNIPYIALDTNLYPALHSLTLQGLCIHPRNGVGIVLQLEVLKLWHYPSSAVDMYFGELAQVLVETQKLRTLEIVDFLQKVIFRNEDLPVHEPLRIGKLKHFVCEDNMNAVRQFLREVDIGKEVRAVITAHLLPTYVMNESIHASLMAVLCRLVGDTGGEEARQQRDLLSRSGRHERIEEPDDYEPVGWIFPSEEHLPSLFGTFRNVCLWISNGALEIVAGSSETNSGQLICRVPLRRQGPWHDSDMFLQQALTCSALCAICSHFIIPAGSMLRSLHVAAHLNFVEEFTWEDVLFTAPELTSLYLEDTGPKYKTELDHPLGVLAVFNALAADEPGRPEEHPAAFTQRPVVVRRLMRSSAGRFFPAARLRSITFKGAMFSASVLRAIRISLVSRASRGWCSAAIQKLTLYLYRWPGDDSVAVEAAAETEYRTLQNWARSVNMALVLHISPLPNALRRE